MNPPDSSAGRPPIEVRCPGCGQTTWYVTTNAYRPFCSARCKNQDFGAWANEAYRVATPPTSVDADDDAEDGAAL